MIFLLLVKLFALYQLLTYFYLEPKNLLETKWFKRLIYLFMIYKCLYWLIYFKLFFGSESMIFVQYYSIGRFKDLAFLLLKYQNTYLNFLFILLALFISVAQVLIKRLPNIFKMALDLLLWFIVLNVHHRIYPCLSAGNFLLNEFLFFNCFLITSTFSFINARAELFTLLHNLSVLAIRVQIMILYFIAGLAKLADSDWFNGRAIDYILQIHHFSIFDTALSGSTWVLFSRTLNYLILFYQLTFPFLIWIKILKKPLLLFGMLMHLYIAFYMGLLDFGLIMILAYFYFWPQKKAIA